MLFNSFTFIFFFFPVVLAVLYATRGRQNFAYPWLVAASLFFYGWWNPANLPLILISMLVNYSIGTRLGHVPHRGLLTLGIVTNLAALGYYKYANFFVESVNSVFATSYFMQNIALPLAISFFTFQQIAYLVDAYRGETREYNFLKYMLFVTFFPQLIAGPIVHHREMMPQFQNYGPKQLNWHNLALGLVVFTIGLMKKVLIADSLSPFVGQVFGAVEQGADVTIFEAWGAAICYTLQLYFDFSGYADMAIGAGLAMGIRLPLNFDSPYKSCSIIEFWRRWHMTLSRFLRDYLYIPLGGKYNRYRNLIITMLLGGFWHGAGLTFIVWGGMHGGYLAINHFWKRRGYTMPALLGWFITFLAVVASWVVFRAESMGSASEMLKTMAGFNGITLPAVAADKAAGLAQTFNNLGIRTTGALIIPLGDWLDNFSMIFGALALAFFFPNTAQITGYADPSASRFSGLVRWKPNVAWNVALAIGLVYTLSKLSNISEFLYFQF